MTWTSMGKNGSYRTGKVRLDGPGSVKIREMLERHIDGFARHSRRHHSQMGELPFTYQERQLPTVLYPALLHAADGASLEQPVERRSRKNGDPGGHGWLDYWVEEGDYAVLLESKHGWLNCGTGKVRRRLLQKWSAGVGQVETLAARGVGHMMADENTVVWGAVHAVVVHYFGGSTPRDCDLKKTWLLHKELAQRLGETSYRRGYATWDAVWRLPPSLVEQWADDEEGESWLHAPAVSFVVGARRLQG